MCLDKFQKYEEKYSKSIGLYVFYFKNLNCIEQFEPIARSLILQNLKNSNSNIAYIGMTKSGFKKRDLQKHFDGKICQSTLRKTICALLQIRKESYIAGKTKKQRCIMANDENKISNFIKENLEFKILPITDKNLIEPSERKLICKYQPALNIKGRVNDELKARLKSLRKAD